MPWAWYPDLQMEFTGFYSYQNHYGKPGKLLVFSSGLSVLFFLVMTLLINRAGNALKVVIVVAQIVIALIAFTYALKSFITFSRCYSAAICPQRLPGIYLMLISAAILLLMSLLPRVSVDIKPSKE
jgi:uncharacterized membrane protein